MMLVFTKVLIADCDTKTVWCAGLTKHNPSFCHSCLADKQTREIVPLHETMRDPTIKLKSFASTLMQNFLLAPSWDIRLAETIPHFLV